MTALILAAGYGTRMYPLTRETPKALLPVRGQPILGHLMEKLLVPELKTQRLVLVSNHRYAEAFRRWLDQSACQVPCSVLDDGSTSDDNRLGSVGDLAFAIRSDALEEDLLILGSDNLFRDPLTGFIAFASRKGAITLGAYALPDRSLACRYGVLTVDAQDRITAFTEKPARPTSSLISTAIYFFPRAQVQLVLEYVSSRKTADTLGSFISWLIHRESVFAYRFRGPWFDIGDIASYRHAEETF